MSTSSALPILSIITLIQCTISGVFGPILLQILISAHLDADVISHITKSFGNSMFSVVLVYLLCPAYLFLAPIAGAYSDQWGRKQLLCITITASILGYGLIWFSLSCGNECLFLLGLFFFSASKIYLPTAMTVLSDIKKDKKNEISIAFGLMYLILLIIIFAAQYGYYLLRHHYEDISFFTEKILLILVLLEIFNLILAIVALPETLNKKPGLKRPLVPRILSQIANLFENKKLPKLFGLLLFVSFFWSLYFQSIYQVLNKKFDFTNGQTEMFIFYHLTLMLIGVTLLYRYFIKRVNYRRIVTIFRVTAIGFIGCGLFPSLLFAQLFFIIPLALGSIIIGPLLCSFIAKEWDHSQLGLLMGIIAPALTITWILSGILPIEFEGKLTTFSMLSLILGGIILLFLIRAFGKKLFIGELH
jgi:MFS family permease